jgi:hypothetical protein
MSEIKARSLQQQGAARNPSTVAMPRFRKQRKATANSKRLSEVVLRALTRAFGAAGPFGIFVTADGARLVSVDTDYFNTLERNGKVTLVGIYDHTAKVADLTEDLAEFFSDEIA